MVEECSLLTRLLPLSRDEFRHFVQYCVKSLQLGPIISSVTTLKVFQCPLIALLRLPDKFSYFGRQESRHFWGHQCYNETDKLMNTTERLFLAVIGTSLQEAVLFAIWRWGLPYIGIELPVYVLILGMIALLVYSIVAFRVVSRTSSRKAVVGLPDMIDGKGKAVSPLSPEGQVRIKDEIWSAWATDEDIDRGEEIIVVGQDGLKLIVRRARR